MADSPPTAVACAAAVARCEASPRRLVIRRGSFGGRATAARSTLLQSAALQRPKRADSEPVTTAQASGTQPLPCRAHHLSLATGSTAPVRSRRRSAPPKAPTLRRRPTCHSDTAGGARRHMRMRSSRHHHRPSLCTPPPPRVAAQPTWCVGAPAVPRDRRLACTSADRSWRGCGTSRALLPPRCRSPRCTLSGRAPGGLGTPLPGAHTTRP
mmetsp:Transcript_21877/g.57067  ORF Transcript_21877/g.57067 Transcript_21877/m.57067 type:complete len:211 (-) Transcript_21877:957-1589(-)